MEWLDPWYGVEDAERGHLEIELRRELAPRHHLHGMPLTAIGRRKDRDDVLFRLEDGTGRVAVIHLTWAGGLERDPAWPTATIYEDIEVWASTCMELQNNSWWLDGLDEDDE